MSLPAHLFQASLQPKLSTGAPSRYSVAGGPDPGTFARYADKIASEYKSYADMPLEEIKTKMVKVETVDEHGNIKEEIKEMAVCPECGETNCPCIARVTVQARIDEENAKGVRGEKKPEPMAIVPQTFNQLALEHSRQSANSRPSFR